MYICIYVFMFVLVSEPGGGLISFYMAWKAFSNIRTEIKKTIVAKTTSDLTFVVQSLSHVQLFATSWTAAQQASRPLTIFQSLLRFMYIESVMPSKHLMFYCPLLLLPTIFPSIRVFSNELVLGIRWPENWSFLSNEYSGLISFWIDWFDILADQKTHKSLSQHHILKASILQDSSFFMFQLSYLCMTTGKTNSKVMSLLFNTLSRFVISFLPRSKHLLILWLQSLSTVILEPKKIKSVTVSTFPPFISHEVMGLDAMIFIFG